MRLLACTVHSFVDSIYCALLLLNFQSDYVQHELQRRPQRRPLISIPRRKKKTKAALLSSRTTVCSPSPLLTRLHAHEVALRIVVYIHLSAMRHSREYTPNHRNKHKRDTLDARSAGEPSLYCRQVPPHRNQRRPPPPLYHARHAYNLVCNTTVAGNIICV